MARGMDPESRPISVAELLARAKEQGADDVVSAVGSSPAATGRRRRGGKDSVSVAELTGEIPRVTSQPKAAEVTQPKAAEGSRPKAAEVPSPKADSPSTPPPTRDFSATDVSKRAAAASGSGAAAGSGITPTPGAPDRPAPLRARPADAAADTDVAPGSGSADAPAVTSVQGVAEQDSGAVGSTSDDADEETTGVIPSMQAYSQVDDSGEDHRVLSAAEREREFERYRNFEDVETGDGPGAATAGGKKKKRGLFGFGRKAENAPTPVAGDDADGHPDRTVTQFIPKLGGAAGAVPEASTPETEREPEAPEDVPTQRERAVPPTDDRYLRFDTDDDTDTAAADVTAGDVTSDADVDAPKPVEVADESPTSEIGRVRHTDAGIGSGRDDSGDTDARDTDARDTGAGNKPVKTSLIKRDAGSSGSRAAAGPASGGAEEQSPTVQWLLLIGQVLAGLAVGVALFWGFTELWRWNVLFALILSVAVIFGLVTLVHVVRRSNDLISTLLALGVGLLVTIGPLVLLLIAGD